MTATAASLDGFDGPSTLLSRAKGGTLVFDEIADFPPEAQAKTVRLLDTLGENAPRVISISQSDLSGKLDSGFRQDLFYRISGVTIPVPALRERVDDIPLLAEHFLTKAEQEGLPARKLSASAAEAIRVFTWPGNVRQMENALRRLAVTRNNFV